MSESLIPKQLYGTPIADATISVYIAPGADLSDDPSLWTFFDVTDDVMFKDLVQIGIGRSDEQSTSTPATCAFTLLNDAGNYTPRRPSGIYYPNMRLGFPVKVVAWSTATGSKTLFSGFVDELIPEWDSSASVATVKVNAKGPLQRIQQGASPAIPTVRRTALDQSLRSVVNNYWPMDDAGDETVSAFGSGIGGSALNITGTDGMNFQAFDGIPGAPGMATFKAGTNINGALDGTASTSGNVYFRCFLNAATVLTDSTVILRFATTGTARVFRLLYRTGGGDLQLKAYNSADAEVDTTAVLNFNIDGRPFYLSVELVQSGADISVLISVTKINSDGSTTGLLGTDTFSGLTVGRITRVDMGGSGTMTDWAIGHMGVSNAQTWLFANSDLLTGYTGEPVDFRILRLCEQAGVAVTVVSIADVFMGPEGTLNLVDALRECELADDGLLYDGVDFGLYYRCRRGRQAKLELGTVDLALDIRDGDVMPPFSPVENTQKTRNDVTVTRKGGTTANYQQPEGEPYSPIGPGSVGVFEDSLTVNIDRDIDLPGQAHWRVHLGTIDQDRYPNLTLDFTASPSLAQAWLNSGGVGSRITVTGLPVTAGYDPDLIVEGYTMTVGPKDWRVELNTSPAALYDTAISGGDMRTETSGTVLGAAAAAGATSLSLDSDYPWTLGDVDLNVAGYKVEATATKRPWTFVAFGTGAAADAAAVVPGLPTGWQAGDLFLVFHATRDTTYASIPQTPATYTSLWTSANMRISYKYATSSESAPTVSYSGGAGDTCLAIMAAVRPATTVSGALVGSATQLNGSAQNVDFPGLDSSELNEVKMFFGWKADDDTSFTGFAEYANQTQVTSTLGNDATIMVGVQPFFYASTTGAGRSLTVTGGAANVSRSANVAFRSTADPYQVATVPGMPAAIAAGTEVRVWRPAIVSIEG